MLDFQLFFYLFIKLLIFLPKPLLLLGEKRDIFATSNPDDIEKDCFSDYSINCY